MLEMCKIRILLFCHCGVHFPTDPCKNPTRVKTNQRWLYTRWSKKPEM